MNVNNIGLHITRNNISLREIRKRKSIYQYSNNKMYKGSFQVNINWFVVAIILTSLQKVGKVIKIIKVSNNTMYSAMEWEKKIQSGKRKVIKHITPRLSKKRLHLNLNKHFHINFNTGI